MHADTRELFTASANVIDPTAAAGMRNTILVPGNTTDEGADGDVHAFLPSAAFAGTKVSLHAQGPLDYRQG